MPGEKARHSVLENAGIGLWESLLADMRAGSSFETQAGEATAINLREELAKLHSETLAEVVQHLRDLGYLKSKPAVGHAGLGTVSEAASLLSRALSAFREELYGFDRWFAIRPVRGWNIPGTDSHAAFTSDPLVISAGAVLRLRALTSLDGVIVFREAPAIGETSLASRVAKYLLHLYGVLPERVFTGSPWDHGSAASLRCCGALLKLPAAEGTPHGILNELANFDAIESRIAKPSKKWNLTIPAPVQGDWSESISSQGRHLERFRKAVDRTMSGENIIFDEIDRSTFGLRLLQIFLWQAGNYFGDLDGLWGAQSDAALLRAAIVGPSDTGEGTAPLQGIVEETDGSICINLPEIYRRFGEWQPRAFRSAAKGQSAGPSDDLGKLQFAIRERIEEIGSWDNAGPKKVSEQEAVAWNRLYDEVDTGPTENDSGALRINYGMRSLAGGVDWLTDRLKDIVRRVKKGVLSFVKQVANFVDELVNAITGAALQAFRFLKRGLSGAIRVASLAGRRVLRMIRGEPFATVASPERWILTRFSFDQDAVVICAGSVGWREVSTHYQEIAGENEALETTLVVGIKVLKILAACTASVTGLVAIRLAMDIFRALSLTPSSRQPSHAAAKGLRVASSAAPQVPAAYLLPSVYLTA